MIPRLAVRWLGAALLAAGFALVLAVWAPPAGATGASVSRHVVTAERGIVRCVNKNRRRQGLAPLVVEPSLGRAARLHARNMLAHGFVEHIDFLGRGPAERVTIFDARPWGVGENLAGGNPSPSSACRSWMSSPGHRANILEPSYTHLGAGFARGRRGLRTYYVQVFGV